MFADNALRIPWEAVIAVFVLGSTAFLSWGAYIMKQLVEHARWMAAANEKFDHALDIAEHNGHRLDMVHEEQERVRMELASFRRP